MIAYVVVQSAVYRHDVGPVAATLEEAIRLGCERAKKEKDDHHEFEVLMVSEDLEDGKVVACIRNVFEQEMREVGLPSHRWMMSFDIGVPQQEVSFIGEDE